MPSTYSAEIIKGSPMLQAVLECLKRDKAEGLCCEERGRWIYGGMEGEYGEWWSVVDYVVFVHIIATMPKLRRKAPKPQLYKFAAITNGLHAQPIMTMKG